MRSATSTRRYGRGSIVLGAPIELVSSAPSASAAPSRRRSTPAHPEPVADGTRRGRWAAGPCGSTRPRRAARSSTCTTATTCIPGTCSSGPALGRRLRHHDVGPRRRHGCGSTPTGRSSWSWTGERRRRTHRSDRPRGAAQPARGHRRAGRRGGRATPRSPGRHRVEGLLVHAARRRRRRRHRRRPDRVPLRRGVARGALHHRPPRRHDRATATCSSPTTRTTAAACIRRT